MSDFLDQIHKWNYEQNSEIFRKSMYRRTHSKEIENLNSNREEINKIADYLRSKRKLRPKTTEAYRQLVERIGVKNGSKEIGQESSQKEG